MKKHFVFARSALIALFLTCAVLGVPGAAAAVDTHDALCRGAQGTSTAGNCAGEAGAPTVLGTIGTITNILIFVIGAVAVIMIIVGGIRYVTSSGDQNSLTAAKNTILYAIVGVVVAFTAYAVVNFVLLKL